MKAYSQFWNYLIAACQSVQAEIGQSALELLHTPQPLPDDTIPTILINDLARLDRGMVLVLDDYQVINRSCHVSRGVFVRRRMTINCCRNRAFSASSSARTRERSAKAPLTRLGPAGPVMRRKSWHVSNSRG
jgi:hypothetical protein